MTVEAAAQAAGVGVATAYRRLARPAFRRKVAALKTEMTEATVARLIALGAKTADKLEQLLDSPLPDTVLAAVRIVHAGLFKGYEQHCLVQEIAELREAVEQHVAKSKTQRSPGGAPAAGAGNGRSDA
jgi:hypothetical protein